MITVVTGTDIEKLKGEFESVINGMNMVGEIPYNVYSELFDVGTDFIQKAYELGKEELKAQIEKMKCPWTCKKFSNCKLSNCPCDDWEIKDEQKETN
jgi:hypothetical protein